jgi:uncharacterized cupredoxin-like copper-binding protein
MHLLTRRSAAHFIPFAVLALTAFACSSDPGSSDSSGSASTSASPACGSFSPGASGGVGVTEHDFGITLDPTEGAAGSTTFNIQNQGPSTHEFVVFKTDIPQDQLPLNKEGTEVDEDASGLTAVDEVEDIAACSTGTLEADLQAGSYVMICNITSHYGLGMHAAFTVS